MKRTCVVLFAVCMAVGVFLTIGSIAAAAPPADGEVATIESLYRLEQLPQLTPGATSKMFSSYDRSGGNDDGFAGTYSKLRVEDGNSVLAEMTGPGCIQRIHLPHSIYHEPGLLGRKNEHIRVYLDGSDKPALDVPLEDIFRGKIDGFPKPLAGEGFGGHYCYVPMPYRNGCKVVVDGTDVKFYAVAYRTYPSADGVVTFQNPPTEKQREALSAAAKTWDSCGDLAALGVRDEERLSTAIDLKEGGAVEMVLPPGPRMIRAVYLKGKPKSLADAGAARIQIRWDGAEQPAVDLPLDYLFCQAMQPGPFRSLLIGVNDDGWYNFMPMPYGKSAALTLVTKESLAGELVVVATPLAEWRGDLGYFHAVYHESLPTEKDKFHPWLTREGRGHYIGTYLSTGGFHKSDMPSWLEGDEWFTCDGELRIHGTGSEDHFNCGWYAVPGRLDGPCSFPLHGFTVYRRQDGYSLAAAFRWQVPDPVPYDKSIEAKIEHGPTNNIKEHYRSAAFFYDAAP